VTPFSGFTEEDLMTAWERCEGRCAVSGFEFSEAHVGGGRARRPYAPSLDRIDPRRGYEPDNVRLVCGVANFAMNALPIALERRIVGFGSPQLGNLGQTLWQQGGGSVMWVVPLVVLTLAIPALSAEKVPPTVIEELRQLGIAAAKAAQPPVPKKTPEQIAAEKKAIKSHCEAFFARVAERDVSIPGHCE
jgi:hypothetical protein